jgi:isoleucyl-tRNA synthetase
MPFEELIKDEINVKTIIYKEDLENYADHKLSINFPNLGKRLPNQMKDIIAASKKHQWQLINGNVVVVREELKQDEYTLILEPKDSKGTKSLSGGLGLISLDLNITPELHDEGIARDLVRFIQQARKDANFAMNDNIFLEIVASSEFMQIVKRYEEFITEQTLSTLASNFKSDYSTKFIAGTDEVTINLALCTKT